MHQIRYFLRVSRTLNFMRAAKKCVRGLGGGQRHEAHSEADVAGLLSANVGVALVPASTGLPAHVRRAPLNDCVHRSMWAYGVAG